MHRCCLWLCFGLGLGPSAQAQPVSELVPGINGLALKTWVFHPLQKTHDTPRPVVIALHGCGGIYATVGSRKGQLSARHQGMTDLLLAQGYSVVWPDSLTPRQETSLCEQSMAARQVQHLPREPNGPHPGLGVHAGRNAMTGPQAWQDVLDLLKQRWPDPAAP